MPDFESIIKNVNLVLQLIFGKNIPLWITHALGWTLLGGLFLCAIWGVLVVVSKIKDLCVQNFKSIFYNPEQKRLCRRRQTFAKHIEYEITRLNLLEDWKDDRFTELEAEVEAEGKRKILTFIPFLYQTRDGLRREKSLSKALASSQAKHILIEGEPGSGKSVALRHVTEKMAIQAKNSKSLKSVIPIYINLKELERAKDEVIDRNLIETFVKKTLTRSNDRDLEQFLDEQFTTGIENGTWFFLFDSFDEIPEILSSTEADTIIRRYGDAIADFLQGGMNTCRGVIASRQFRGPKQFGWPRFRVLALTQDRQLQLIRKVDLNHKKQNEFIELLSAASQEIRSMASNPLFLALLCEHVKSGYPFPRNAHTVFEAYVGNRLERDKSRLQKRFKIGIEEIRAYAENISFCMASDMSIGLSPTREAILNSLVKMNMETTANLDTILDALEYTKLGRPGNDLDTQQARSFTFAHRRFQEYFATCVVLRDPTRIPPLLLLSNARWRETAVTMCQMQPINTLTPLIEQAEKLLAEYCNSIPNLIEDLEQDTTCTTLPELEDFPWPSGSLHLLSLLQEGFTSAPEKLPTTVRTLIDKLVLSATETGRLDDRKWALEVSGCASETILDRLITKAFSSESQWLKNTAYQQASRLKKLSPSITQGIYDTIIRLAQVTRLKKEKYATQAHLSRLQQPATFLETMKLMLYVGTTQVVWNIALTGYTTYLAITSLYNYNKGYLSLDTTTALLFAALFLIPISSLYLDSFIRSGRPPEDTIISIIMIAVFVGFFDLITIDVIYINVNNLDALIIEILLMVGVMTTRLVATKAASVGYRNYSGHLDPLSNRNESSRVSV